MDYSVEITCGLLWCWSAVWTLILTAPIHCWFTVDQNSSKQILSVDFEQNSETMNWSHVDYFWIIVMFVQNLLVNCVKRKKNHHDWNKCPNNSNCDGKKNTHLCERSCFYNIYYSRDKHKSKWGHLALFYMKKFDIVKKNMFVWPLIVHFHELAYLY